MPSQAFALRNKETDYIMQRSVAQFKKQTPNLFQSPTTKGILCLSNKPKKSEIQTRKGI